MKNFFFLNTASATQHIIIQYHLYTKYLAQGYSLLHKVSAINKSATNILLVKVYFLLSINQLIIKIDLESHPARGRGPV